MNQETLQRLLADSALGMLSYDMEELLAEHLRRDAEAAQLAETYRQAAHLAAEAMTPTLPHALPPLPMRAARFHRAVRATVRAAMLAACALTAFTIGRAGLFRWQPAEEPPAIEAHAGPIHVTPGSPEAFWSVRLLIDQRRGEDGTPRRLVWTSPVYLPQVGDGT